jgi:hypothetical protein
MAGVMAPKIHLMANGVQAVKARGIRIGGFAVQAYAPGRRVCAPFRIPPERLEPDAPKA